MFVIFTSTELRHFLFYQSGKSLQGINFDGFFFPDLELLVMKTSEGRAY